VKNEIIKLKKELNITVVAHYYQKDEIYELADIVGDSFELAKKSRDVDSEFVIFCGVGFMGESLKVIAPNKRVLMPKIACCSMAKMIDEIYFDRSVDYMINNGIPKNEILPITYINSSAKIKAKVGEMNGYVCTSSIAKKIVSKAVDSGKKILFVPDKCLGVNVANSLNLSSMVIGESKNPKDVDIVCFDGFCNVHQLFTVEDIEFYRSKYSDIVIAVHPECTPEVVAKADFVGSTTQIIDFVKSLSQEQKVAIGREYNLVNRITNGRGFVLSSTKPECPTMNETTIEDLYRTILSIRDNDPINEIFVDSDTAYYANIALDRMLQI